jgi:hypothetical protein
MTLTSILQLIVALGLLNVWLVRIKKQSGYRGGEAKNLKDEFTAYGLAPWVYFVVGALKIGSAFALILGLWISSAAFVASILVAFLMLGAIAMHIKIHDPIKKSVPAILMLVMSLAISVTTSWS